MFEVLLIVAIKGLSELISNNIYILSLLSMFKAYLIRF